MSGEYIYHQPVLLNDVLTYLQCQSDRIYVDMTVGGGGHAEAILANCGPFGELIGVDQDPDAIAAARTRLSQFPASRFHLIQANFSELLSVVTDLNKPLVDGILFDLGVSSFQIDEAEKGFSYQQDSPLDMRMNPNIERTAKDLVNHLEVSELAHVFRKYGEEKHSYKIARAIEQARENRPIETTDDLVDIIKKMTTAQEVVKTTARIFQALRIEINNELEVLSSALQQALKVLKPGGRIVVISYHSLEDRIVKTFFQDMERGCTCPPDFPYCVCNGTQELIILTKKVIRPSEEEIARNSRARSAKLRAAERVASE